MAATPGTAVPGTTTLAALVSTVYPTLSADLGAATYTWETDRRIIATFPAGTTPTAKNASMIKLAFEARPVAPSSIKTT